MEFFCLLSIRGVTTSNHLNFCTGHDKVKNNIFNPGSNNEVEWWPIFLTQLTTQFHLGMCVLKVSRTINKKISHKKLPQVNKMVTIPLNPFDAVNAMWQVRNQLHFFDSKKYLPLT